MKKLLLFLGWLLCSIPLVESHFPITADPERITSTRSEPCPLSSEILSGTALNIARAMATAGLVDKVSGMAGIRARDLEMVDYAKKAAISSAVNTVMSVAIDHQDFKQAMLQGMASAAVNTVASWGAGQIGGLYSQDAVNYGVHKALHGLTGAGLGAGLAAITHQDPRLGAVSGAFGAVMSEMIAEGFKPEMADVEQYHKDHPGQDAKAVQDHFITRMQNTTNWAAFVSAATAFGVGLDPSFAHTSARNALENNCEPTTTIAIALMVGIVMASPQYWRDLQTDEPQVALKKLGINAGWDSAVALATGCAFEVAGVACKTLSEAISVVVARNPMLKSVCAGLESRFTKIEAYVRDQFNYRAHFAAEREAVKAPVRGTQPAKQVRFVERSAPKIKAFEAEDVSRPLLPGEGCADSFGALGKELPKGSNLAKHHMPNDQYMRAHGVSRSDGVAMLVEHPTPGTGGRHREIHKQLIRQDPALAPRDALAQSVSRARAVYRTDGVLPEIRADLLNVAELNKTKFPNLFKKGGAE